MIIDTVVKSLLKGRLQHVIISTIMATKVGRTAIGRKMDQYMLCGLALKKHTKIKHLRTYVCILIILLNSSVANKSTNI